MNERSDIVRLFETIGDANNRAGDAFQVNRLSSLLFLLHSGEFFALPADEQVVRLGNQCEAYVGRGDIMWGLTDQGWLPADFGEKMKITVWRYFLTLDIPESSKRNFRDHLTRVLKE